MKFSLLATALVASLLVTGCFNNTPVAPEVMSPAGDAGGAMMDTMPAGSGEMGDPNMVGGDAVAPEGAMMEGAMTPAESGSTMEAPAMMMDDATMSASGDAMMMTGEEKMEGAMMMSGETK